VRPQTQISRLQLRRHFDVIWIRLLREFYSFSGTAQHRGYSIAYSAIGQFADKPTRG